MNQNDLAAALSARLTARLPTFLAGIGDLPNEDPSVPYAIIYPLGLGETQGSWQDPQDTGYYMMQVTCVGLSPEQTAWAQEFVRETIMDRTGSGWTYSLAVSGSEPEARELVELGSIIESDTEMHQCDDTYRFRRQF